MASPPDSNAAGATGLTQLHALLAALRQLRQEIADESEGLIRAWQPLLRRRSARLSAPNLAAYLALRRRDLRPLQRALMPWGLSSLGRSEARVLPNLDAVIASLAAVSDQPLATALARPRPHVFFRGERLLHNETVAVLGTPPPGRQVRIMVTLPSEAATQPQFVAELIRRGMDVARINCAHDDAAAWEAMIAHVRQSAQAQGRSCRVLMDLAGPKVRTGPVLVPADGRLRVDDQLLLRRDPPSETDEVAFQAMCLAPEVFESLRVGDAVWVDDGRLVLQPHLSKCC